MTNDVWVEYFGAEWCAGCAVKRPLVEQLCREHNVPYVYRDVDDETFKTRATMCGFRAIPGVVVWSTWPGGDPDTSQEVYKAYGNLINREALESAITRARTEEVSGGEG